MANALIQPVNIDLGGTIKNALAIKALQEQIKTNALRRKQMEQSGQVNAFKTQFQIASKAMDHALRYLNETKDPEGARGVWLRYAKMINPNISIEDAPSFQIHEDNNVTFTHSNGSSITAPPEVLQELFENVSQNPDYLNHPQTWKWLIANGAKEIKIGIPKDEKTTMIYNVITGDVREVPLSEARKYQEKAPEIYRPYIKGGYKPQTMEELLKQREAEERIRAKYRPEPKRTLGDIKAEIAQKQLMKEPVNFEEFKISGEYDRVIDDAIKRIDSIAKAAPITDIALPTNQIITWYAGRLVPRIIQEKFKDGKARISDINYISIGDEAWRRANKYKPYIDVLLKAPTKDQMEGFENEADYYTFQVINALDKNVPLELIENSLSNNEILEPDEVNIILNEAIARTIQAKYPDAIQGEDGIWRVFRNGKWYRVEIR